MNYNEEKDPFAEYDKYWDQSEEKKEKEEPEDHYFQSRDFQNQQLQNRPRLSTSWKMLLFSLETLLIIGAILIGVNGYFVWMKIIIISLFSIDLLSIIVAIIIQKRNGDFYK